jgi:sugar-specific transcriptional regulator TrmB
MATDYKATSELNSQALIQAGLTGHQAAIYEALIHFGSQKATKIAFLAGVPRTLSYKVLQELQDLGLISKKDETGSVSIFTPAHPLKLKELADKRLEEAKGAKAALEGTLSKLISDFNTVAGSPGVRILEGIAGVAELYEDQLNEGQTIRLIRSPRDHSAPGFKELVEHQIREQVRLKMLVRVISPRGSGTPHQIRTQSKERLVERRVMPAEEFQIPAEVVIYANKVALTAFEGPLITTIIENAAIRQTFEILFEYIWAKSEPEHIKIMEEIHSAS